MKKKLRFAGLFLVVHLLVSGVLWGSLLVYQRGYNTMHREQIAVASVITGGDATNLQVLEHSCTIPASWLAKDSALYYAAFAVCSEPVRLWMQLFGMFPE